MGNSREFNEAAELDAIEQRYTNVRSWLPFTLERLRNSDEFQATYRSCVAAGFKDWHILSGIANITWTYRLNHGPAAINSPEEAMKTGRRIVFRIETADEAQVPINEFTLDAIEFAVDTLIVRYLTKKGWEVKRRTPNLRKMREVAHRLYKFMELDVPHDPIFAAM